MNFIGIDPGASGGIAIITANNYAPWVHKMPDTPRELADMLSWDRPVRVIVERVGPARGRDGRQQGVSSAFTFGQNFGQILGVLAALKLPHELVTPVTWQREFGLVMKGETNQTVKKNKHKAEASRLFPGVKVTHAVADALLLAEWLRRRESNRIRDQLTEEHHA